MKPHIELYRSSKSKTDFLIKLLPPTALNYQWRPCEIEGGLINIQGAYCGDSFFGYKLTIPSGLNYIFTHRYLAITKPNLPPINPLKIPTSVDTIFKHQNFCILSSKDERMLVFVVENSIMDLTGTEI